MIDKINTYPQIDDFFEEEQTPLTNERKIVFAVIFFLAIVAVVIIAYRWVIRPLGTPLIGNRVLVNGTIVVDANSDFYIEFSIPEGPDIKVLTIKVTGDFIVSNNNTIRVYVTDEKNLNPLSTSFSPYYDSGISTSGKMNVTLSSGGTYYLFYNNLNYNYNTPTNEKEVTTRITLGYMVVGT